MFKIYFIRHNLSQYCPSQTFLRIMTEKWHHDATKLHHDREVASSWHDTARKHIYSVLWQKSHSFRSIPCHDTPQTTIYSVSWQKSNVTMPRYSQKTHLLRIVTVKLRHVVTSWQRSSVMTEKWHHHDTIQPESSFTPYCDRKAIHSGAFHATIHPKLPFTPYRDRNSTEESRLEAMSPSILRDIRSLPWLYNMEQTFIQYQNCSAIAISVQRRFMRRSWMKVIEER